MGVQLKNNRAVSELHTLAKKRLKLPEGELEFEYQADADLLLVRLSNGKSTYSEDDMREGIIYNYNARNKLVSIEILDLYGVFV
ncbi:hypothetical protein BH20ACI1_BH20ACI1_06860 [soil metagenome]